MPTAACPHCGVPNEVGSAFCGSCGKALPTAAYAGPRVIAGDALATTAAGLKLQSDELRKQAMKAANALLIVAVLQTVIGAIAYAVLSNARRTAAVNVPVLFGTIFGVAILFWGLYFWARYNPLPAAIVGLVVYVTLWALDIIMALVAISNAPPTGAGGGMPAGGLFNGIIIRILIIAMLARAIKAGILHRKLMRQQAMGPVPV